MTKKKKDLCACNHLTAHVSWLFGSYGQLNWIVGTMLYKNCGVFEKLAVTHRTIADRGNWSGLTQSQKKDFYWTDHIRSGSSKDLFSFPLGIYNFYKLCLLPSVGAPLSELWCAPTRLWLCITCKTVASARLIAPVVQTAFLAVYPKQNV